MPVSLHPSTFIDGRPARLRGRAYKLLLMLTQQRHRVMSRSELLSALWPNETVNENNLNVQIAALRKVLGPDAIVTIPGRGYRLIRGDELGIAATGPAPPPADLLNNLPAPLGELIGRADDLAQLEAMLPEQPLVTVVGAGGIGKTRLALEAARTRLQAHSDGVWWIDLSTLATGADADAASRAVAAAIGLSLAAGKVATDALTAALQPLNALIVLDNAEHVAQATATVVRALQAAPSLRWLVTSQVPLKLKQEQLFALGTLSVPPADAGFEQAMSHGALALLVQRAHAVCHGYQLDPAELGAAIAICRRLDGIALAIEMAASRLAWIGADALNRRLAMSLSGLGPGSRVAPTRQQTLQATLDWSHALLSPAERAVLRRLGVFVGGFTVQAAQRVGGDDSLDEWAVLDALFGLAEKSWVQVGQGHEPRYRLLESARLYALVQLSLAGEEQAVRSRHAEAMAVFSDWLMEAMWLERMNIWSPLTVCESDNLVEAFDWAVGADQANAAARIFVALAQAMNVSRPDALQPRADALRPRLAGLSPSLVARVLISMGLAKNTFNPKTSIVLLREATTLPRAGISDAYWMHYGLSLLSQCLSLTGQPEEARAIATQARAMQQPGWPGFGLALLEFSQTYIGLYSSQPESALAPARRTIELGEAVGALSVCLLARSTLVTALVELKRYEDAVLMAAELWPLLASLRYSRLRLVVLINLIWAHTQLDALALAQRSAEEAMRLTHSCGHRMPFLDVAAGLALRQGRPEVAAQLVGHVQATEAAGRWHPRPTQLRHRRDVLDQLVPRLSADELAHWLARGAALSDDQIDAFVCDEPSRPP
jgi:predicted ATPase